MKKPPRVEPGSPLPLGATRTPTGVNFAIFSRHATAVTLVLGNGATPGSEVMEIPLIRQEHRTGDIWHAHLTDLPPGTCYGYRVAGPHDPRGSGHFYDDRLVLLDPYARELCPHRWGEARPCLGTTPCSRLPAASYDWQGDRPLNRPLRDTIIYEMHVRGFTRHPSSGVRHPGTFRGVTEKIPYLRKLGITAVELMPVTEFNENEAIFVNPETGERLKNYWGYSPLSFFAPKSAYCSDPTHPLDEFRDMVKALHRAGIEVILDIVYNHTGEGGADGPTTSFRGIDNTIYYLLDPWTKAYLNFSGCGNTCNCNHPIVRTLIMDALRWWVVEMHVDGFRFDLASILGRDQNGEVLSNPPVVEMIAEDPVLADSKIIAEAWDAAGLYQVGSFSPHHRWAEWNGRFRDDVRAFMRGDPGMVPALATRIAGSSDLYQHSGRRPCNSINFITSHDGFTLADLVSYNEKHNLANGEDN
ncbi:MAG TPA: glycogen-debranching protein, partial [Desulfobulbus sp.]|nr:glycogen-debranching protein [Desulfobulbus sp.]